MDSFKLWEDDQFTIGTPKNPQTSYNKGLHVIVSPKQHLANAWQDVDLTGETFKLTANACKIMENLELAPWFNIQANGNWGLLPGNETFFHVHIYGRNKTETWGKPIILPEAPGTYQNDPMPEADRNKLINTFKTLLVA